MGSILCPSCGGGSATRLPNGDYACSGCLTVFPAPTTEGLALPDSIGEVIGYRAWHVVDTSDGPRLASTGWGGKYSRQIWHPGEVCRAICAEEHQAPDEKCGCGFYAARTRDHLLSLNRYHLYDPDRARLNGSGGDAGDAIAVVGQVAMDGKVVPATLGWRAENAWPINIEVPHVFWRWVVPLRDAYGEWGVEVTIGNTLAMPKAEGPKWCSKCGTKLKDRAPSCHVCGTLASD